MLVGLACSALVSTIEETKEGQTPAMGRVDEGVDRHEVPWRRWCSLGYEFYEKWNSLGDQTGKRI